MFGELNKSWRSCGLMNGYTPAPTAKQGGVECMLLIDQLCNACRGDTIFWLIWWYNDKSDAAATCCNSVFGLTGLFNDKSDEATRCQYSNSSCGTVFKSLITVSGDGGNNKLLICLVAYSPSPMFPIIFPRNSPTFPRNPLFPGNMFFEWFPGNFPGNSLETRGACIFLRKVPLLPRNDIYYLWIYTIIAITIITTKAIKWKCSIDPTIFLTKRNLFI